jgi:ribonuclease D
MFYLKEAQVIEDVLADLSQSTILWIDTEVADYKTKNPRLSLIQVSAFSEDLTGDRACIFDVLEEPSIVNEFINSIMANTKIEKVFHNASYDLRFLGGTQAKNVTCTLKIAKSIPYYILPVKSHSLKSLVLHLTEFNYISKDEQGSDWGVRPLTDSQLKYAALDTVYLAQVHHKLLQLLENNLNQETIEDLSALEFRYQQIEESWMKLDSEMKDLKERIKNAMKIRKIKETALFKLTSSTRKTIKLNFSDLEELIRRENLKLDLELTLSKENQQVLNKWLEQLPILEELNHYDSLRAKLDDPN